MDALVEGYEDRIESIALTDVDDRHVLAAAVHCGAHVIVTANLRDFPASTLAAFGIEAVHPDEFLVGLLESDEGEVVAALCWLRASLKNPPRTAADLIADMKRQGLTATADAVGAVVDVL